MTTSDGHYDLIVIGSGPAGVKGAVEAAYHGRRVALVETASLLGGAGLNTGTVPSKTLRETALYFSGLRSRGLYGIDYSLKEGLTIRDFTYRQRIVSETERDRVRGQLERHRVDIHWGHASLRDAHTVAVRESSGVEVALTGDIILIATGSSPFHPPGVPFDGTIIHDSDSILKLDRLPQRLIVVGGGVVGTEYASVFTALGLDVTMVQTGTRLLPFVDGEVAGRLRDRLEQLGMRIEFNQRVDLVEVGDSTARLTLQDGRRLEADAVLYCTGRASNTEGLGLQSAGVQTGQRGLVLVDDIYRTTVPNIFATGDVIGFPALASTSMEQSRVAMAHAFDLPYKDRIAAVVPLAIYSIPEIAMAGLTEEQCHEQNIPHLTSHAYYDQSPRGQLVGDTSGMLKLIFSPIDQKLIGVHIIGEGASELVHLGAQALCTAESLNIFTDAVFNYPTLSDLYKLAAYDALENIDQWQVLSARQT
jgi:NAD(P) transhydrogenase